MHISEYDYDYPEQAIALHPPKKRGGSKLFVVLTQTGEIIQDVYENLDRYIASTDVLVRNTTKVFRARIQGVPVLQDKTRAPECEIFLTEPHAQTFEEYAARQYDQEANGYRLVFLAPKRKLFLSQLNYVDFGNGVRIKAISERAGAFEGVFCREYEKLSVDELFAFFEQTGKVPLPPYIRRETEAADAARYQTIFAEKLGSVAAPTASLNFTKTLEKRLRRQGTTLVDVTLHVGRGTFLPLRHDDIEKNELHFEPYFLSASAARSLHQAKFAMRRVIAMGTTAMRTLETVASELLQHDYEARDLSGETNLFIYPPFEFRLVDALVTNFHFPKSSLITLVDAFLQHKQAKQTWREIYEYAIQNDAKLFSYGDSLLIL